MDYIKKIIKESKLDKEEENLLTKIRSLVLKLRKRTLKKYDRINPFYEDFFQWEENANFYIKKKKNIRIYNSVTITGKVKIKDNTWIGPFCSLDGGEVGLTIGNFCSIATSCHLFTHDTVKYSLSKGKHKYEYSPTKIGNGCFIGASSIITKGVELGDLCLVAAGSLVTRSFKKNSIIGGVPAKLIGEVVSDNNKVILKKYDKLMDYKSKNADKKTRNKRINYKKSCFFCGKTLNASKNYKEKGLLKIVHHSGKEVLSCRICFEGW